MSREKILDVISMYKQVVEVFSGEYTHSKSWPLV